MQINKKVITMAITALLLLSMLAAAIPAYAAPVVSSVTDSNPWAPGAASGFVGDRVRIQGTAAAGGLVSVYWDNVGGSLLNSTYALGTTYDITVTIPDAKRGSHFLIVTDSTGSVGAGFTVNPLLVASPTSGIAGDTITLTGTGYDNAKPISIAFGVANVTPAAGVTTSATGFFTTTITVPATIGGNPIVYQAYSIVAAQSNVDPPTVFADATFTVGASVSISPTSGPAGTIVTINGRGFIHSAAGTLLSITIGSVTPFNLTTMRTAADGTFTGTFVVPSSLAVQSTRYAVAASDGVNTGSTSGTGSFRVTGTTLISTVASSAPGDVVTITGSNFTAQAGTVVKLNFGVLVDYATFTTDANGGFTAQMTVPYLTVGTYTVVATDSSGLTDSLSFIVAITSISATPSVAPVGTVVTVSGYGFTGGDTFNVTFAGVLVATGTVVAGTPSTVTATFTVPTINPDTYSIIVMDFSGLTAETTFTVNATSTIALNPSTAPKDIAVTITATNFGSGSTLNFYITNSTWGQLLTITDVSPFTSATTNSAGTYKGTFTISAATIALGSYTIVANNTNGGYANRFNATTAFTLGTATLNVSPRAASYRQGDLVSFKIQSSYNTGMTINIADPEGTPLYLTVASGDLVLINNLYTAVISQGNAIGFSTGPMFLLSADAVVGTWSWNVTVTGAGTKKGTFEVTQGISEELSDISDKLDSMNVTLVSISGNVVTIKTDVGSIKTTLAAIDAKIVALDGKVVTLDTKVGTVQTSITSLPGTIQTSVQNGLATVTTSIGTITTKLDSIDAVLGSVAGDVATLSTSVGTVTTTLTALNAKVVSIEDNVATIVTDVGTLQGVVTQIQGDVASIDTGVGTIQTSVANIQPEVTTAKDNTSSMSTMIYVAVAFAIIAAIAAVASILLMRKKIAS